MKNLVSTLLFLALAWGLSAPYCSADEAVRLRSLLHDVVEASGGSEPQARAEKIRAALSNNGDALFFLLEARDRAQVLTDAGFGSLSVGDRERNQFLAALADFGKNNWRKYTAEERAQFLRVLPDKSLNAMGNATNFIVERAPFSRLPVLEAVLKEIREVKVPGFSPEDLDFLANGFLRYFDHLPLRMKRRVMLAWLNLPPGATPMRQLSEVLQNSGPALQKLFQFLGKESASPELRAICDELLANIKRADFTELQAVIERDHGKPLAELFLSLDPERLGTASVGEVHRAVTLGGATVAVKVVKPGVAEDMAEELGLLAEEMKGNASAEDLVQKMREKFLEEIDLRIEARNLREGAVYEDAARGLFVPKVSPELEPTKNTLVMSLAEGTTLNRSRLNAVERGRALATAYEKWFAELLFGGGFFHGDPHPGNIMIAPRPGESPPFRETVIDFGSAGRLGLERRKDILYLFAAVQSQNVEDVMASLENLGEFGNVDRALLSADIKAILKNSMGAEQRMSQIVSTAFARGVRLSSDVVMFSRAGLLLFNELKAINKEIKAAFPGHRLFSTRQIYLKVGLKSLGRETLDRILQRNHGEFLWDSSLFRTLAKSTAAEAWHISRDSCGKLFTRLRPRR